MSDGNVQEAPPIPATPDTVLELIQFILPRLAADRHCPTWPPDLFAIVASVLRRTGAYVRCVATLEAGPSGGCLDVDWENRAYAVGADWRANIDRTLETFMKTQGFDASLRCVVPPSDITEAWDRLLELAAISRLTSCPGSEDLARELLHLNGFADQASAGIGMPSLDEEGLFKVAADSRLIRNSRLSLCWEVSTSKARVLPKKHTPQQGLTLRSLTHHLALCMPWEVNAEWVNYDSPPIEADLINMLLLPWPRKVDATFFQLQDGQGQCGPARQLHRQFRYSPGTLDPNSFEIELRQTVQLARTKVSRLHMVVFPELALSCEEWTRATKVANEANLLLVAGIHDDKHESSGFPVNSCRVQFATMSTEAKSPAEDLGSLWYKKQAKHHRWCLDRTQVLQYDLGGQLPAGFRCWENSHVESRNIFFATVGGWLTFSVLICEDLARQDPIADVMRAVGPNLVIALLMDGPQIPARWSSRYAGVLADDPGTSVLSLTSLGMCLRSKRADQPNAPPSRVVALWKDKIYGAQEIALAPESVGCVLSLVCETREEFTADGRTDGGATQVPVFAGITQV